MLIFWRKGRVSEGYALLNTCYFLAVLLRTEFVVQLLEGAGIVDMYGTCASEILNGLRPPKTHCVLPVTIHLFRGLYDVLFILFIGCVPYVHAITI
jgi:hypothetical protein